MALAKEKPKFSLGNWYKERKQKKKEKEEQERALESAPLKMITFLLTAVAMGMGMSFLPLFPDSANGIPFLRIR